MNNSKDDSRSDCPEALGSWNLNYADRWKQARA
jgi:hypothetical protein